MLDKPTWMGPGQPRKDATETPWSSAPCPVIRINTNPQAGPRGAAPAAGSCLRGGSGPSGCQHRARGRLLKSKKAQTSGKPHVWVSYSALEPGDRQSVLPDTAPSSLLFPSASTPTAPHHAPQKGSPSTTIQPLSSSLTLPASSSPPSPSQAQGPLSACSPHAPGVRKQWGTLPRLKVYLLTVLETGKFKIKVLAAFELW